MSDLVSYGRTRVFVTGFDPADKAVAPSAADASSPAARRMMTFAGLTTGYASDGGTARDMRRWIGERVERDAAERPVR